VAALQLFSMKTRITTPEVAAQAEQVNTHALEQLHALLADAIIARDLRLRRTDRLGAEDHPQDNANVIRSRIVAELARCGSASPAELRKRLGLSRGTCADALRQLSANGVAVGEGSTKSRTYRVAQQKAA
jgi:biotin operon repressor